jgi:hypothetical protein
METVFSFLLFFRREKSMRNGLGGKSSSTNPGSPTHKLQEKVENHGTKSTTAHYPDGA